MHDPQTAVVKTAIECLQNMLGVVAARGFSHLKSENSGFGIWRNYFFFGTSSGPERSHERSHEHSHHHHHHHHHHHLQRRMIVQVHENVQQRSMT